MGDYPFSEVQAEVFLALVIYFDHAYIEEGEPPSFQEIPDFEGEAYANLCESQVVALFNHCQYDPNAMTSFQEFQKCQAKEIMIFISHTMEHGGFSVAAFALSILILQRFKQVYRTFSVTAHNWKLVFLSFLLVADKVTEDKAVKNGSFPVFYSHITAAQMSIIEHHVYVALDFKPLLALENLKFVEKFKRFIDFVLDSAEEAVQDLIDQGTYQDSHLDLYHSYFCAVNLYKHLHQDKLHCRVLRTLAKFNEQGAFVSDFLVKLPGVWVPRFIEVDETKDQETMAVMKKEIEEETKARKENLSAQFWEQSRRTKSSSLSKTTMAFNQDPVPAPTVQRSVTKNENLSKSVAFPRHKSEGLKFPGKRTIIKTFGTPGTRGTPAPRSTSMRRQTGPTHQMFPKNFAAYGTRGVSRGVQHRGQQARIIPTSRIGSIGTPVYLSTPGITPGVTLVNPTLHANNTNNSQRFKRVHTPVYYRR